MKDNRERLESVALDLVQRNGLKGISFRTLADEIGVKSSSVHYYFPEKSDLAHTLIERYSDNFFHCLTDIKKQRWGLRRKISAFITIFEEVANADKLCLCGMMAAEIDHLSAENRELLQRYFLDTEKWLTELFESHSDEITSTLPSKLLAKTVLSGLEGALLVDRVVQDGKRLKAQKELVLALLS